MIKPVGIEQLDEIINLIQAVVKRLIDEGIDQWDELYPGKDDIETDIKGNLAFGYFKNGKIVGYIVLNEETNPEYNEVEWEYDGGIPLIIHRLSVHPDLTGCGIATEIIDFAEMQAVKCGYSVIRLDVFSQNTAALHLYEKSGYRRAGSVSFRKGKFFLYEKRLQDI